MKQLNEKTYWKYIDGECNQEEKLQIEALLLEDPSIAEEMLLRTTLHEGMDDIELELPSLDFSKNVMAALPEKRTISEVAPLVSKRMKISFASVFTLISIGLFSVPFLFASQAQAPISKPSLPFAAEISAWWNTVLVSIEAFIPEIPALPTSTFPLIIATIIGFVILGGFDAVGRKMWDKKLGL